MKNDAVCPEWSKIYQEKVEVLLMSQLAKLIPPLSGHTVDMMKFSDSQNYDDRKVYFTVKLFMAPKYTSLKWGCGLEVPSTWANISGKDSLGHSQFVRRFNDNML